MSNYKILSHTADLRLAVYGKTLEELFINAAEALARILSGAAKVEVKNKKAKIKIKVASININSLLVDFLNELLSRSQIDKAIYLVKSLKLSEKKIALTATLAQVKVSEFAEDVKAVTYHEANIIKADDSYKTKLVLDI